MTWIGDIQTGGFVFPFTFTEACETRPAPPTGDVPASDDGSVAEHSETDTRPEVSDEH
jgi:hypothetical protein